MWWSSLFLMPSSGQKKWLFQSNHHFNTNTLLCSQIATDEDSGVLLYKGDNDHIAMELYRGRLRVSYDTGSYPPSAIYRYMHAQAETSNSTLSDTSFTWWMTEMPRLTLSVFSLSQRGDSERWQLPRCGAGGSRPDFVSVHRRRAAKIHQLHQQTVHTQHRFSALPGRWGPECVDVWMTWELLIEMCKEDLAHSLLL